MDRWSLSPEPGSRKFLALTRPSGSGLLPARPPLRTVLESFPSYGSSPSNQCRWWWHLAAIPSTNRLTSHGWAVRVGCPWFPDAPDEAATLLEVFGVGGIVGIGFPFDFDMAFNLGAGHPI